MVIENENYSLKIEELNNNVYITVNFFKLTKYSYVGLIYLIIHFYFSNFLNYRNIYFDKTIRLKYLQKYMVKYINYKDETDEYYHFYKLRYTEFDYKNINCSNFYNISKYLFRFLYNHPINLYLFKINLSHSKEFCEFYNKLLKTNLKKYVDLSQYNKIEIDTDRINELYYKNSNIDFNYDEFIKEYKLQFIKNKL